MRSVGWISAGAASAVACKLAQPDVLVYCRTGSEHPDNVRFLDDVARWIGTPVDVIGSEDYADTWEVWEKTRWLAGIEGARCTVELKTAPRLGFQHPTDLHILGYTCDASDVARSKRLQNNYPEVTYRFPLIEKGIDKAACLAMLQGAGINLPPMYALGFQNNNCIPCVKATSPAYWALVRREFPEQFNRMAKLSRELGVTLCRIEGERAFIDEIPLDHPTTNPIQPSCDFLCHLAEQDMA